MTGSSTQGIKTGLHPMSDLATAKAVYAALLGVPPQTDESYYVGFEAAGRHIPLVPGGGPQGMTSPVAYWHVPGIEPKLAEVIAAGATVKEPVRDVGGGRLVAAVTDPDGNVLGLLQDRAVPTLASPLPDQHRVRRPRLSKLRERPRGFGQVRPVAPGGHSLFGGGQQPSWLFLRGLGGSRGPRPRLPVFVGDQPTGPLAAGVTLRMGLCLVWSDPRGLDRADFPVLSLELLG